VRHIWAEEGPGSCRASKTRDLRAEPIAPFPCELVQKAGSFLSEFTPLELNKPLQRRFLSSPMVVLLTLRGKCSRLRAKVAHFSGHLPPVPKQAKKQGNLETRKQVSKKTRNDGSFLDSPSQVWQYTRANHIGLVNSALPTICIGHVDTLLYCALTFVQNLAIVA
jgi:hypothetical protein